MDGTLASSVRNACGGCTYCCWAFNIEGLGKRPQQACMHEEPSMGCKVHDTCHYPEACRTFVCPYLLLERGAAGRVRYQTTGDAFHARIHRPDLLEAVVKEILEVSGTVFPAVPVFVAVEEAIEAARKTRCLPVCSEVRDVMNRRVGWDWHLQMLGEADKSAALERWSRLMVKHG